MRKSIFYLRCEDFMDPESCEYHMESEPMLSYFGTCFTSKNFTNVSSSGMLSSIEFKLNISRDYTTGE